MNKLSIAIAALALLSPAAFAEGNHDVVGYGVETSKNSAMVQTRIVRTNKETSAEGLNSFQGFKSDGRGDHGGGR